MRFFNTPHRFYCAIDLHARSMHVCILDQTEVNRFRWEQRKKKQTSSPGTVCLLTSEAN
jgi:hypothetical protein